MAETINQEATLEPMPTMSEIDWNRYQDVELVKKYGNTRERWRQRRREGNYPDATNKGKNTTRVTLAAKLRDLRTEEITLGELHKRFEGSRDHLLATLKYMGKPYKKGV